jgi:hypothetical protein
MRRPDNERSPFDALPVWGMDQSMIRATPLGILASLIVLFTLLALILGAVIFSVVRGIGGG